MGAESKPLSWSLMDAVRDIGVERGVDLVLHVLFARWLVAQAGAWRKWNALMSSTNDEELASRFAHLDDFWDTQETTEVDAFRGKLRAVLERVDAGISASIPIGDQQHLVAETFEEVLEHLSHLGKQSGEFDTPHSIAELMTRLTVRAGDHVLDPACGNGTTLLVAARSKPHVSVSGFEINHRVWRRASMRLLVHGIERGEGFGASRGDAFLEHSPEQADVILAQPPFNVTLADIQRDKIRGLAEALQPSGTTSRAFAKGDMPWVLLALGSLRRDGRAALLLSSGSLLPRYRDAHELLLRLGAIEAIISLPSGMFRHTSISTALWLVREPVTANKRDTVLLLDAQTFLEATEKGRADLSPRSAGLISDIVNSYRTSGRIEAPPYVAGVVPIEEISLEHGLNPQTYLSPTPEKTIAHPVPDRTLLSKIELSNFKAFSEKTRIPLAPLTFIYGANSAGKSTVIQSLLLLKQSRDSDVLVTQGSMLNVGGFRGIVHRHTNEPVEVAVTYGVLPSWIPDEGSPNPTFPRRVHWSFSPNAAGQGTATRVGIQFGEFELTFVKDPGADNFSMARDNLGEVFRGVASGTLLYPFDTRHYTDGDEAEQAKRLKGRENNARQALRMLERGGVDVVEVRAKGILPTDEVHFAVQRVGLDERRQGLVTSYLKRTARLAAGVSDEMTQLLNSVVWLGPLRSAPQRVYDRADSTSTPGDGRHVAIYLFDHATVVEQVNSWLERLEIHYTLDVVAVNAGSSANLIGDLVAIVLTDTRTGVNVTPADVGFGVSQVLPIVVELLARRDSVVAIEQPETHLHPRLQAGLADLFIQATQEGGQGNQLLVETHSEHIMLRIQRRVREGSLDPSSVSIAYVDQGPDGETMVKQLRLNDQGEFLDEWPQGFFDERLDELFGES